MSHLHDGSDSRRASAAFRKAAAPPSPARRKHRPAPFSLRLSTAEREILDAQAGSQPLGAYIRERLLGEDAKPRRRARRPSVDDKKLALVLAELGKSRLASNVNQLAKAVNTGTLDVSRDVEREILMACSAIKDMRDALITALGLKAEAGQSSYAKATED